MPRATARLVTLPDLPRLGLLPFAALGALVSASLAAACWLGLLNALIGCNHAFVAQFTSADPASAAALRDSVLAALPFGAGIGAAIAVLCNQAVRIGRR